MSVTSVLKAMQSSADRLVPFAGRQMDKVAITELAQVMLDCLKLPDDDIIRGCLVQTLSILQDVTPDQCMVMESFRRVAENKKFILAGSPVPEWLGEQVSVRVSVLCAWEERSKKGDIVGMYFRVLSGLPAGRLESYKTSARYIMRLFRNSMGLSRLKAFLNPLDIAGMHFSVTMRKDKESGFIKWEEVHVPPSCLIKNKGLIDARNSKKPCGRSAEYQCWRCPRTRKQCSLAVR